MPGAAIIGGKAVRQDNTPARYVVMLVEDGTGKTCTGTLISERVILTAAHCIRSENSKITLAFGINPISGKYQLRKSKSIRLHPQYRNSSGDNRYDLALVSITGDLPTGFSPVQIVGSSFPLAERSEFSAIGYGRVSGLKPSKTDPAQGIGRLRQVSLRVSSFSADQTQLIAVQNQGKGICSGDSGGPALMRYKNIDYIVGVASAVTWSAPSNLTGAALERYLANKDYCSEKAIYMNVQKFTPWILKTSKELMN